MFKLIRTNSKNKDFIELVRQLDAYLTITDGDEHDFYHQFNGIDHLNYCVLAYNGETAIGCGAIKLYQPEVMEIKRMYTSPDHRNHKIASRLLKELEKWAGELGANKCILETGLRQVEAVQFYRKNDYKEIPNYGQYAGIENSLCFEKKLQKNPVNLKS